MYRADQGLVDAMRREFPMLNIRWNRATQRWCVVHPRGVHWEVPVNREPFDPREARDLVIVASLYDEDMKKAVRLHHGLIDALRGQFRGRGNEALKRDLAKYRAEADAELERSDEEKETDREMAEDFYYSARAKVSPYVQPKGGWPTLTQ